MPCIGSSSSSTSRIRRRPRRPLWTSSFAPGTRPSPIPSSSASASSCARTRARRSPRGSRRFEGVRPERPFAFELDGVLVNGRLDVLWMDGRNALVLDYKTNVLNGRDPAEIVESEYSTQQTRLRDRLPPGRGGGGRGRLPLPRGPRRGRVGDLHGRRRRAARGGALRDRSRVSARASFQPDAERVRLLWLSGARRRLCRAAARRVRRGCVRARPRVGGVGGAELRLRGAPPRSWQAAGADRADRRAARRASTATPRSRSTSAATSSC